MNAATSSNAGRNVIAFAFAIGERVAINAIDTSGLIQAITITKEGIEYRVAYFDDDKRRQLEWLDASEMSRITG